MSEFVEGYQFLSTVKQEVTVLGSARTKKDTKYYKLAREVGKLLAKDGYTIMTGGGPGIMEAANRGAKDAGGESIGINIQLPFEQTINPFVTKSINVYYFFTRKVFLTSPAHSFLYFPGGYGTLDEFFEVVNHMDLGKMCHVPTILVGPEYWNPLLEFLQNEACSRGIIDQKEVERWIVVDSAKQAQKAVKAHGKEAGVCELSPSNFHSGQADMDWRVFSIMAEIVQGFEFLTGLVEDVTVLGTRSIGTESPYYAAAKDLGKQLAENGYATVTGGADGIAEAANKGAMTAGGESYGIGLTVNNEQRLNDYLNKSIMFKFPFTRKLIVTAPSKAFVFFPGGFGTMHHLLEVLTLIQTGKMQKIPIILYDSAFWAPFNKFIEQVLNKKFHTISPSDASLYTVVDDIDDAMKIINKFRKKKSPTKK